MAAKDPETRRLIAKMGAYAQKAKYSAVTITEAARRAFMRTFEDQVDPDRLLSEEERGRRAAAARKARFIGMGLKSAKVRKRSLGVTDDQSE